MVLNGNLQLSAPSAEEKMAEKKIMRAISKRRQKERNSQILEIFMKFLKFFTSFKFSLGEIRALFLVGQDDQSHARLDILFLLLFPLFFLVFNCIYWLR